MAKDAIKANGHIVVPEIKFADVKQRQLEKWTKAFQDEGGHEVVGVTLLAGATVRALLKAEILQQPVMSLEDVDDAPVWLIKEIWERFDKLYVELTTIPKA